MKRLLILLSCLSSGLMAQEVQETLDTEAARPQTRDFSLSVEYASQDLEFKEQGLVRTSGDPVLPLKGVSLSGEKDWIPGVGITTRSRISLNVLSGDEVEFGQRTVTTSSTHTLVDMQFNQRLGYNLGIASSTILTPYIGLGLGLSRFRLDSNGTVDQNYAKLLANAGLEVDFGGLIASVGFEVSNHNAFGDVEVSDVSSAATNGLQLNDLTSSLVHAGLGYKF